MFLKGKADYPPSFRRPQITSSLITDHTQVSTIITLTSDWGNQDFFAGMVKGMLYTHLPDAHIVDITHNITPFDTVKAAFVVKQACTQFPKGTIHIIDVDSVETESHHFVIVEYKQQWYICTDNGLPALVFGNEWTSITRLDSSGLGDRKTFVAYDLFCKVAILLASDVPASELGPAQTSLVPGAFIGDMVMQNEITTSIQYIDAYGNAYLNLTYKQFKEVCNGRKFKLQIKEHTITKLSECYESVGRQHPIILTVSATGFLQISTVRYSAEQLIGFRVMENIKIQFFD